MIVTGRVQGVAFRWTTVDEARALGLAGWVRNLPDGRVETRLEGEPGALERMLIWLREGPPAARVRGIEVRPVEPEGVLGFEMRWGGPP